MAVVKPKDGWEKGYDMDRLFDIFVWLISIVGFLIFVLVVYFGTIAINRNIKCNRLGYESVAYYDGDVYCVDRIDMPDGVRLNGE